MVAKLQTRQPKNHGTILSGDKRLSSPKRPDQFWGKPASSSMGKNAKYSSEIFAYI
jgi:hypothetical protein